MPWPSSAVNSGPHRFSQAHSITETRRNSQPTCSTAFCSSPVGRPDLQSQAKDLNRAIGDMSIDQLMMEHLEERPTERVRLAAALPGGNVQFLQPGQKFARLAAIGRTVQPQFPEPLEMPDGAPQLLTRVAAEHRIKLAVNRREAVQRDPVAWNLGLPPVEAAPCDDIAGQRRHRSAHVKFVGLLRTAFGEPPDQGIDRRLAM